MKIIVKSSLRLTLRGSDFEKPHLLSGSLFLLIFNERNLALS